MFPHFHGDVALYQIFANIKDKIKTKKILGIFKVKSRMNVEELKEEITEWFKWESYKVSDYLDFIHEQTEKALNPYSKWVLSLHSRNLKCYIKTNNRSILGDSMYIKNFLIRPSSESFIEFGLTNNNNILLPLIDAIIANSLPNEINLIRSLNWAIQKFNLYTNNFPDYKKYLTSQLRSTSVSWFGAGCPNYSEYIVGLQQTYLKILKNSRLFHDSKQILKNTKNSGLVLSNEVINKDMYKSIFVEDPPLLYFIEYFKQMIENINFEKQVLSSYCKW